MKKVFKGIYESVYDFVDDVIFMFSVSFTEMLFLSIGAVFVVFFTILMLLNIFG